MFGVRKQKSASQLTNENNTIALHNANLIDQLNTHKKMINKYQSEYNQLSKKVSQFCKTIFDNDFVSSQEDELKGANITTMLEKTIENYKARNIKNKDMILELTSIIKAKDLEIKGLSDQLALYINKEQRGISFQEDTENQEEESVKEHEEEPAVTSPNAHNPVAKNNGRPVETIIFDDDEEIPEKKKLNGSEGVQNKIKKNALEIEPVTDQEQLDLKIKQQKELDSYKAMQANSLSAKDSMKAHVIDLNNYIDKIDEPMRFILEAIGEKGLSERKDIMDYIVNERRIPLGGLHSATMRLIAMDIIKREKINTGHRWFWAFELSVTGNRVFLEMYKKNPLECERQMLRREHATEFHGYCIKDSATLLKNIFKYDAVSISRKVNTVKTLGEIYIPDIIAKKDAINKIDYFEVELGHHMQKDFNKKCNKMCKVTRDLYFIAPDLNVLNKVLIRQVGNWVIDRGGKENLKGITVYLTTIKKLSEGKWETIINM